jgi:NitT/TauT family transport system substrate-binding protein
MKKGFPVVIVLLMVIGSVLLSGCTGPSEIKEDANETEVLTELRFGYQPSTHQIAYMTADVKGWWLEDLAPFGIKKTSENEFPTGAPEMQAMLAGHLDAAYVGAAPVISALSQGLDAKIVAGVQTQGSNLVLRNDIQYDGPDDLKGLKLATYPPGTIQDTVLKDWLIKNGVDPYTDVDILPMGPGDAITAISAGKVDGVFLPHPGPAIIESEENGRSVIASGEMLPDHACCVLVVSGKLIREEPELVKQIVKTHIKATEYNKAHIDEAAEIFVQKTKMDIDIINKSLAEWDGTWISDPDLIVNSTVNYTQVQYDLEYIKKPLTKEEIFDTSFYEAVKE